MQLSETVKLYPTKDQCELLISTMNTYIATVNGLVSDAAKGISIRKHTSADVHTNLPSALKNQCIRDANSILKKHYKACHNAVLKNEKLSKNKKTKAIHVTASHMPVLKRPCCYINNQNYSIRDNTIAFPVMINGKSTRIAVATRMPDHQKDIFLSAKLATMRIVVKGKHLAAQIVYEAAESESLLEGNIMGIDLGIKCPGVSYCSDGSVKFYGNGRSNKYMRRQYRYRRKKLQKAKKPAAVKRTNGKEQRIMKDIDHKISHEIIKTAVEHNVNIIQLEQLQNIRSTTRTSRKNNYSLHAWSFYRLAQFIEYKAKLSGITVLYVNPAYTSQTCPNCGQRHHAKDRNYTCECGFHTHRDIVGAMNICHSTEVVGKRRSA